MLHRKILVAVVAVALSAVSSSNCRAQSGEVDEIPIAQTIKVTVERGTLIRTKLPVFRTHVADPTICDFNAVSQHELSIIGLHEGKTHVTFWTRGDKTDIIRLEVIVLPKAEKARRRRR